jgi:hypothetical protein
MRSLLLNEIQQPVFVLKDLRTYETESNNDLLDLLNTSDDDKNTELPP